MKAHTMHRTLRKMKVSFTVFWKPALICGRFGTLGSLYDIDKKTLWEQLPDAFDFLQEVDK